MILLLKNSEKTFEGVFVLLSWFNSNMHFKQLSECDSERYKVIFSKTYNTGFELVIGNLHFAITFR